jgi:HlyD family secretion protein
MQTLVRTRSFTPRWILLIGLAVVIISVAGATLHFQQGSQSQSSAESPSTQTIVCFGYVDVEHGVTPLYPLMPGRVVSIEARESQFVEAGAVLIRLDERLAQLRLQEAEADLAAAEAQYRQAEKAPEQHQAQLDQQRASLQAVKARLTAARFVFERKQELETAHHLNAKEVQAAAAQIKELEAAETAEVAKLEELQLVDPAISVRRAKADVQAKQARLEQARRGVEECLVKAPSAGTVLRILVSPGEVLGSQPQQPAVVFAADGPRLIRADVSQEFAALIAVGQSASIEDDSGAPGSWRGQVARISRWYAPRRSLTPDPFHVNETRTLECLLQVDSNQPPLILGRRMRVTIEARYQP